MKISKNLKEEYFKEDSTGHKKPFSNPSTSTTTTNFITPTVIIDIAKAKAAVDRGLYDEDIYPLNALELLCIVAKFKGSLKEYSATHQ